MYYVTTRTYKRACEQACWNLRQSVTWTLTPTVSTVAWVPHRIMKTVTLKLPRAANHRAEMAVISHVADALNNGDEARVEMDSRVNETAFLSLIKTRLKDRNSMKRLTIVKEVEGG